MRRSMGRGTRWAGPVLVVVVAVLIVAAALRGSPVTRAQSNTSTNPTDWVLPSLSGNGNVHLAAWKGKPVVVTFFASWCTACEGELPEFAAAQKTHPGVVFVGVDSVETGDGLAMARRLGLGSWPLARDVDGKASSGLHDALGGIGMPITAFYSAGGQVLYVSPGALTAAELDADLERYAQPAS